MRASRRGQVPPFQVMRVVDAVVARRAAGLPVFDLSAGQPSTPAPRAAREAVAAAVASDRLGYTGALGTPELRGAIAEHYLRSYGVAVDPGEVAVTTGSSGGFQYAFLAAFEPGDVVALARPGYPAYRNILTALGCRVLDLPCGAETRFQPTVAMLEALPSPPAGLVLASPANPTGTMVTATELAAVTAWCALNGTRLISDEIYHGIAYERPGACAWQYDRSAVVVNSLSKYWSMTGWRVGWLLMPADLRDAIDRLAGNLAICPPAISQVAATAALTATDDVTENVERYRANRTMLLAALPAIGVDTFAPPDGAFYVYADVSRWTTDSLSWCRRVLEQTGVALVPGVDFDPVDGARFIRLCFAGDGEELRRAVEVLGEWLVSGAAGSSGRTRA